MQAQQRVIYPEEIKPTTLARYLAGHLSTPDLESMEPGELEALANLLKHWQQVASVIVESRQSRSA